jgi:hypothetical protein
MHHQPKNAHIVNNIWIGGPLVVYENQADFIINRVALDRVSNYSMKSTTQRYVLPSRQTYPMTISPAETKQPALFAVGGDFEYHDGPYFI